MEENLKKLTQLKKGQEGHIAAFDTKDKNLIKKMEDIGLHIGCHVVRKNSSTPVFIKAGDVELALGKDFAKYVLIKAYSKTIFMLGNPNVGKSSLFSRITGVKTASSNYPGTTISLLKGEMVINNTSYNVFDTPGTYSLDYEDNISKEACELIKKKPFDIALYVLDAQHMERNLLFAMDVISLGKPTILILNKFDIAQKKGIDIDKKVLSEMLGVPVVVTNGLNGDGLKKLSVLIDKMVQGKIETNPPALPQKQEEKWQLIGEISKKAQKIQHRHPSVLEKIEEAATTPFFGILIALIILISSFCLVLFLGEHIIDFLSNLYESYYLPFIQNVFAFCKGTFLWDFLIGVSTPEAEGFGLLTEGLKIPFIDVMPYVVLFYAILEFLGELGYLPRLAILLDRFLHKLGLHGYSAIPIMLGLGCKVPALLAAGRLETRRQKIIAMALIFMMAPCISQSAIMFSMLAPFGIKYIILTFGIMFVVAALTGTLLNKILPGDSADIFMEVPSWQWPKASVLGRKIWQRTKEYLFEAVPLILAGMVIISVAQMIGLVDFIGKIFAFPTTFMLGLPQDTSSVVILGVLRKDVSIALLEPFNLTAKQLVVASIFMSMYLPCVASFFVMLKEAKWKDTLRILAITLSVSLLVCSLLNIIL